MERFVSSFGAPRKIEGMKSRKTWVIERETMRTIRKSGEKKEDEENDRERRNGIKRFM